MAKPRRTMAGSAVGKPQATVEENRTPNERNTVCKMRNCRKIQLGAYLLPRRP